MARPYAAVVPSLEGDVLVALARTRDPLTGREVARLVKTGSQAGVLRALRRLVEQGVVDQTAAGRSLLFSLNRDHVAFPVVEQLGGLRAELVRRLQHQIRGWKVRVFHASLFGSAARGDGDAASDLDLFLVRRRGVADDDGVWRAQVADLAERARRWTGNRASVAEVSERELAELRRTRPAVVANLERDAIALDGQPVAKILRPTR